METETRDQDLALKVSRIRNPLQNLVNGFRAAK